MNQVFYTSFHRDIKKIKDKTIAQSVRDIILLTSLCQNLSEIPNLKKIKGHKSAFRIRIDGYRIGLFIEDGILFFAAFDHRGKIYRRFP